MSLVLLCTVPYQVFSEGFLEEQQEMDGGEGKPRQCREQGLAVLLGCCEGRHLASGAQPAPSGNRDVLFLTQ